MKKREANFGVLLRHWLKANPRLSSALELKQTTSNALPFNALEPQQIDYLLAVKGKQGTLIRVQGIGGEPDYVYLRNAPATVVIRFRKEFHLIDIDAFLLEKKRSKRKSLTNERARDISIVSVKI